jgi:hypothetical protein
MLVSKSVSVNAALSFPGRDAARSAASQNRDLGFFEPQATGA